MYDESGKAVKKDTAMTAGGGGIQGQSGGGGNGPEEASSGDDIDKNVAAVRRRPEQGRCLQDVCDGEREGESSKQVKDKTQWCEKNIDFQNPFGISLPSY